MHYRARRIVITIGTAAILMASFLTYAKGGDRSILFGPGQPISIGRTIYTVNSGFRQDTFMKLTPPKGKSYFLVEVEVKNTSKTDSITFDPRMINVTSGSGNQLVPADDVQELVNNFRLLRNKSKVIPPGESTAYTLAYLGNSDELTVDVSFLGERDLIDMVVELVRGPKMAHLDI